MKILLMRHGLAATVSESGVSFDAERPLTEEGESHAKKVAEFLKDNGVIPAQILCTPFLRSNCTAEIISQTLGNIPIQASTAILPGAGVDDLIGAVSNNGGSDDHWTLVCAHEPDTSYLMAKLLLKKDEFPLAFLPGDMYAIHVTFKDQQAVGKIVSFYSPINSEIN
jgi:phosphohistidine phosphatase